MRNGPATQQSQRFEQYRERITDNRGRPPSLNAEGIKLIGINALGEMRRNVPEGEVEEPKPYVRVEHIPRRSLALDAWETAGELPSDKLEFKKGEVLFSKIHPYFHPVSVAPPMAYAPPTPWSSSPRRRDHYTVGVACGSSDQFVTEPRATVNGARIPRANCDVLQKFAVVIPKGKKAKKYSALFADSIAQQQALNFQIQSLRRPHDLLLPSLLSGLVNLPTKL